MVLYSHSYSKIIACMNDDGIEKCNLSGGQTAFQVGFFFLLGSQTGVGLELSFTTGQTYSRLNSKIIASKIKNLVVTVC